MRTHFPTDQTFSAYIQSDLAGDFAWQLATMRGPGAAPASSDANSGREQVQAAADAREALQEALQADKDMSAMPHWGGIHHDMYQQMRTISASLKKFAELFPVLLARTGAGQRQGEFDGRTLYLRRAQARCNAGLDGHRVYRHG